MRSTSVSGSAKVPSALGAELGSTRDLDLGGGADADALRGAGVLSAASSLSFWRFSDALPRSASSSGVGGGCCGGGGIDGAAAFAGRSPLGVEGLGGLTTGGGTAGGGLLGGGPNGGLLNLLGLELPLSGTAALGSDALASDALAGALASDALASGTDATSAFAFGGLAGSAGTAEDAAAVERQGAAPTEDVPCGAWWIDLTEVVTIG